jgi:dinuclear metal center YbgI/SA1388 family protein
MKTAELVSYLDTYLNIRDYSDSSRNGLQVQGREQVRRIGAAVDACVESILAAAQRNIDFLIVHHGLIWERPEPAIGSHYERLKRLFDAEINLYAAHLPLDAHPEVGNNAVICRRLGFEVEGGFGEHHGKFIGVRGRAAVPPSALELLQSACRLFGEDTRGDMFGPERVQTLAVCSGAGAMLLPEALAARIDCFITGEPRHSFFHYCKENRMNAIYGGHYATETFGVIALAEHVQETFHLPYEFIDAPSGM